MMSNGASFALLGLLCIHLMSYKTAAADSGAKGVDVIFCGNPGVGKSTLLSSVSGLQFESGLSWGEGLTSELRWQDTPRYPNLRFGDTPGLADIGMAKKAAEAISRALNNAAQMGRVVKLFFVVTTEAGRFRQADLFTVKQVMESITLPSGAKPADNSYGLIVNKCDYLNQEQFLTQGKRLLSKVVGSHSQTVPFTTTYIKYLPNDLSLTVAANAKAEFPGLSDFVFSFPGIAAIDKAAEIDVSSLEEKLAKAAEVHNREIRSLEERLRREHQAEVGQVRQHMQTEIHSLQRKMDSMPRVQYVHSAGGGGGGEGIAGAMVGFAIAAMMLR